MPWFAIGSGIAVGLTLTLMVVGLVGLVIPIFPGGLIIWLAALLYGLATGLHGWGLFIFIVISALAIAGSLVDNVLMGAQARKEGASWWSLFFATIGGIAGTIFFPPFGGLIAAPLLLLLSEYWRHRKWRVALRITRGLLIGWGWSFLARFGIGVVMILLWVVWAWTNSAA